jgi:hypothetical protein
LFLGNATHSEDLKSLKKYNIKVWRKWSIEMAAKNSPNHRRQNNPHANSKLTSSFLFFTVHFERHSRFAKCFRTGRPHQISTDSNHWPLVPRPCRSLPECHPVHR